MKRATLFFLAALAVSSPTKGQDLVVEYESDFNREFLAQLVEIRTANDLDLEEDGIPEIVLIETDDNGNQTFIRAFDGRSRALKWEFDLTGLGGNGVDKLSSGVSYTHRDSLIWRGFRRIRRISGISKSKASSERLAIFYGDAGGVLLIDPVTSDVLLDVGDDFVLLSVFDIDNDGLDEVLIGDKPRRVVMVFGDGSITSVETGEPFVPAGFHLAQNYPNPFNPSTTINYKLENTSEVNIQVYNMLGQVVRNLVQADKPPGSYSVVWNGKDDFGKGVASGNYYYQLKVGEFLSTKKMLLLK